MTTRFLTAVGLLALAAPAFAASDLVTTLTAPSVRVYESGTWAVTVANDGPKTANSVVVSIELPQTHTSPTNGVMGLVLDDGGCTLVDTTLTCDLGRIRKNRSVTRSFDLLLPEAAEDLYVTATASFSGTESNPADNVADVLVDPDNYDVPLTGPVLMEHSSCTGTDLTSFFECTCFPASIQSFEATYEDDGSIAIAGQPDYSGLWWQNDDQHLAFELYFGPDLVAWFDGYGTSASCFEGLTQFPGSTWVAPYESCVL
jgi:hypothetical protein